MTKSELIDRLKEFDDDDEIGAFWDDCEWDIITVFASNGSRFDVLIDCS